MQRNCFATTPSSQGLSEAPNMNRPLKAPKKKTHKVRAHPYDEKRTPTCSPLLKKLLVEEDGEVGVPFTRDVSFGAFLFLHLTAICENCGVKDTPQWRKGWYSSYFGKNVHLCNACGLKYSKNQFCPYCQEVYGKENDRVTEGWLSCRTCGRQVHGSCETLASGSIKPDDHYKCPGCRGACNDAHSGPNNHHD